MFVGVTPSIAIASDWPIFDWSIKASESETVEVNSNQFLKTSPAGSVGSYTTLKATAEGRTATSKLDLDGDGTYRKYWGPGVEGLSSEFLNYGFKGHYEINEKNKSDREYIEGVWRQQSTALAILNDLGVSVKASGFIDRATATGALDRSVTHLDTVSLLATSTRTSYEPSSGGLPFNDTLAKGSWRHSLSPISTIVGSSEYEQLNYENSFNTQVQIYREQIGIDLNPTALISFRANAGVAYLETHRGVSTSPIGGTTSNTAISGALTDWIGDAVLTYRMLKNTTLVVTAAQSVGPTIVGTLLKRDTAQAILTQKINSYSTLSFSAGWNRQTATTSTDFVIASATYSYTLAQEWLAQFTYRYQHRFPTTGGTSIIDPLTNLPTVSSTGAADSHSIMMVVTHNWTVLPSGSY
jgi:hypothetical protein